MARDSLPQWKALSDGPACRSSSTTGVLFFFPDEQDYFDDTIAAHQKPRTADAKCSTGRRCSARFPMIDFAGVAVGLFEAGFRRADGAALGPDAGRPLRPRGRRLS